MCRFFSLVTNGKGRIMYFDWELREKCIKKELNYEPDSHTSIADYFGFKGSKEDTLNKYEYNPLTKNFTVDQLNTINDSKSIESFCKKLDFKKIIPQLILKPIVHPFELKPKKVGKKDIELLKQWNSVRDSVRDSVWNSVWDSVGNSVWDSVGDSVGDSVRDSVRDSVWDSVGDSVRDSVRGYTSSFFNLPKWKYVKHPEGINPFQCVIDLWERGFVPSFDGKVWRLHSGENGKIIFEISKKDLKKDL